MFDLLNVAFKDFVLYNHIKFYLLKKNIAIINFILTCKLNKDYVFYKTNPIGYFARRLDNLYD